MLSLKNLFSNKYLAITIAVIIIYFVVVKPLIGNKNKSLLIDSIKKKPINESNLTISSEEASDIASDLYQEMDGVNLWANNDFWDEIFDKVQTKDDAILVSKAFGIRNGDTLYQWLRDEINLKFLPYHKLLIKKFQI